MAEFKAEDDYIVAALRHLETCKYMYDYLDKIPSSDNSKLDNVLLDIYYLTGYVIECAVTFGMLKADKKNIMMIRLSNGNTSIQHNYKSFIETLIREYPDFTVSDIIDNSCVKELYDSWRTDIRYSSNSPIHLDQSAIINFITLAEDIYRSIIAHFTKTNNKTSKSKRKS